MGGSSGDLGVFGRFLDIVADVTGSRTARARIEARGR